MGVYMDNLVSLRVVTIKALHTRESLEPLGQTFLKTESKKNFSEPLDI